MNQHSMHPLIIGLVDMLPTPGTKMGPIYRGRWLTCAEGILTMLYPQLDSQPGVPAQAATAAPAPRTAAAGEEVPPASPASIHLGDEASRAESSSGGVELQEGGARGPTAPDRDESARIASDQSTAAPIPETTADRAPTMTPSSAGEEGATPSSPAPKKPTPLQQRIVDAHREHPEANAYQLAQLLDMRASHVQHTVKVLGIDLPKGKAGRKPGAAPTAHQQRVIDAHKRDPSKGAKAIADMLGVGVGSVCKIVKQFNLTLPSGKKGRPAKPAESVQEPVSEPAATHARRELPAARQRVAARPRSAVVLKPMVHPKGARFFLRDDAGQYLHFSGGKMTDNRDWAWQGSHDQLLACRKTFSIARDLREQVVEKEPVAA